MRRLHIGGKVKLKGWEVIDVNPGECVDHVGNAADLSRFESGTGSNPEEMLAAAEAACYSMAFSGALERNGTPATSIDTTAKCTVERVNDAFTITRIELNVNAVVPSIDDATFQKIAATARDAYSQAGITDPRHELALAEVHDCFTITELVLMEDLGFSERGAAWRDELDGVYDLGGELPVNPDGGLKSFGHPVGASGLRMMFEAWLQLRAEAPADRRISTTGERTLALTHNLGGYPGEMVSFVSILGTEGPRA